MGMAGGAASYTSEAAGMAGMEAAGAGRTEARPCARQGSTEARGGGSADGGVETTGRIRRRRGGYGDDVEETETTGTCVHYVLCVSFLDLRVVKFVSNYSSYLNL